MNKIRIACTAISGRIMAGRINKAGTAFIGNKEDVTSDVMKAIIDKLDHHGGSFEITCAGELVATITLEKPQQQAEGERDDWKHGAHPKVVRRTG